MIFNVAEKMYNSYALSNYLDVNIFPVPLPIEDWFSISFKALATLKFDYYIHDEQGNQLVNRKFVLHKDHERTTKINAKNLPSGLLFHKFVFEDNSIIQMTTIKQ